VTDYVMKTFRDLPGEHKFIYYAQGFVPDGRALLGRVRLALQAYLAKQGDGSWDIQIREHLLLVPLNDGARPVHPPPAPDPGGMTADGDCGTSESAEHVRGLQSPPLKGGWEGGLLVENYCQ
jgi:hypothetical protein